MLIIGAGVALSEIDGMLFINASTKINGSLNVTGNVTADYFIGNGSLLTGIVTSGDNNCSVDLSCDPITYDSELTYTVDTDTTYSAGVGLELGFDGMCYQEFANVSTSCGGLATGGYLNNGTWLGDWNTMIDGNFSTKTFDANGGTASRLFINYTKPTGALNSSLWFVKYGGSILTNFSIHSDCWNQDVLQFLVNNSVSSPDTSHDFYCYDGNSWFDFNIGAVGLNFFEEAMWWDLSGNVFSLNTTHTDSLYLPHTVDTNETTRVIPLSDNSMADTLHRHSELSASNGSPDKIVYTDSDGVLYADATGIGLDVLHSLNIGNFLFVGNDLTVKNIFAESINITDKDSVWNLDNYTAVGGRWKLGNFTAALDPTYVNDSELNYTVDTNETTRVDLIINNYIPDNVTVSNINGSDVSPRAIYDNNSNSSMIYDNGHLIFHFET